MAGLFTEVFCVGIHSRGYELCVSYFFVSVLGIILMPAPSTCTEKIGEMLNVT